MVQSEVILYQSHFSVSFFLLSLASFPKQLHLEFEQLLLYPPLLSLLSIAIIINICLPLIVVLKALKQVEALPPPSSAILVVLPRTANSSIKPSAFALSQRVASTHIH